MYVIMSEAFVIFLTDEGGEEKGEGRREKGEGRREKGEGGREKAEERREKRYMGLIRRLGQGYKSPQHHHHTEIRSPSGAKSKYCIGAELWSRIGL